jgi:hypothetical protein
MQDMKSLGEYVQKASGSLPKLVSVILPTSSADIYLAVKQFGDVHVGVRVTYSVGCFRLSLIPRTHYLSLRHPSITPLFLSLIVR